jgi:type IV conjugative transfer system coupling protein TraD
MKKAAAYKYHETFQNAMRMSMKMYLNTFRWILVAHLSLILFISVWWYKEPLALFFYDLRPDPKNARIFFDAAYAKHFLPWFGNRLLWVSALTSGIWILYPTMLWFYKRRAQKQAQPVHLRGAKLLTPRELHTEMKRHKEKTDLTIGGVLFPQSAEVKHALILGRPGAGKTVLLSGILDRLIERGEKGIIYDFKGDYVERFYRPERDLLFNPVDERCVGWKVFNEIKTVTDIDAVAHSLIPSSEHMADHFWNEGARDVLSGLFNSLYHKNQKTNSDIWKAVSAPSKDISAWLKETPGAERGYRYVEDPTSKQAMSFLAVMMQYVKCFELLSRTDGDFRIGDWLEKGKGWIFVTNDAQTTDTLRPMVSLFIDLLARRLLSMPDDYDRRLFFILDEFGTLQLQPAIKQLLTLSRSKGGSVWLGIQDVGQIDHIYGEYLRQAIVNACGTAGIFSVSDPKTAKFLSTKIGETEFLETEETYSMGVADNRDGVSLMRRRKVESLILDSEIMLLKDLELFLQIPNYHMTRTQLIRKPFPVIAKALQFRPDLDLDRIIAAHRAIRVRAQKITGKEERIPPRTKLDYDLEMGEDLQP